jgi:ribosome biogenesis GTPase
VERVLVANADQLAVVTATANPEPSTGLIDRALVAAFDAGLRPILIITKVDVGSPADLIAAYEPLDVPIYLIGDRQVTDELRAALTDHCTVLVGHSGVGKSTMVNALVPDADRRIGHVNVVTGKGRHTSTSAIDFPLPGGGSIIDTPGIRSFGLAHVTAEALIRPFEDLHELTEGCPRSCSHDEPDCALNGLTDPVLMARVASLRRLLRSRSAAAD